MTRDRARPLVAEALGTGLLVLAVVGSGITAVRLSPNDVGLQLLENAAATAAALLALILVLGPVSGAHLNPVVTLVSRCFGHRSNAEAAGYIGAQVTGGCLGAMTANVMFGLPLVQLSGHARGSGGLWVSEVVATLALLVIIWGLTRAGRADAVAPAVAAWIGGAYFFTSSTSFANPAVTLARTLSDSFAGIRPSSVPVFVAMQLLGSGIAFMLIRFLFPVAVTGSGDLADPGAGEARTDG